MNIKKTIIKNKEVYLFKSKKDGEIFLQFKDLIDLLELNNYYKNKFFKELEKELIKKNISNKEIYLFNLSKMKIFNNLIKNLKSEEIKEKIKENKKGIYTQSKIKMKAFLPDVLKEALVENKLTNYFNNLADDDYYNDYKIINNNLYSIKSVDTLFVNKKILSVTKSRNNKKTIKEITFFKVSKEIELLIEKEKNKVLNKKINKLQKLENKLTKELEEKKEVFDFWIDSKYLFSYNKALVAAYTNKLVTNPKYKSWQDNLVTRIKKETYFKYIIEDKIFNFVEKNKIDLFLKIYIYISPESKEKNYLPDTDNFIKPIQDAISKALGVDDKYFIIKNFEFVEVKCYEEQGYYFGLQKTKE